MPWSIVGRVEPPERGRLSVIGTPAAPRSFARVVARAGPAFQISIETRLLARPIRKFVERHVVEVIGALEPRECRHRDKISARNIVGFTVTLADVRAS
jgi:hypothetical protein